MTISALLLGRQFYSLTPAPRLAYATLGLLFANISVGGLLTHFHRWPPHEVLHGPDRFDFLGFEFYWEPDRQGKPRVKRRTATKKWRPGRRRMREWIKEYRPQKLRPMMTTPKAKLRGMWNYYGLICNHRRMKLSYDDTCLKSCASSELFTAIQGALQGKIYITPLITKSTPIGVFLRREVKPYAEKLTDRQREVLQLLAEGRLMKEVADILSVTPRTVAFHKYAMMEELGVKTSAELVQYALQHRIVGGKPQLPPVAGP